jgi:diguanylate cyclase (GGDEF)-like protein/PAS domain S-box-containing protein
MSDDAGDVYKTLLESTKAIPWSIDWESKQFEYIGPQIEELLGWTPDSWATAQDWIDRIHPDFREEITNYCISQSESGVDHEADYPALTKNGDFVWIRDVVHVVREGGVTKKLIGFMFDISERKRLENELLKANKKLQAFSYQDGLTGLANRRLYDTTLEEEWQRAMRSGKPLSMILLDIDRFKEFNDHYGHIEGDKCLNQISRVLENIARRSIDLCARYGGEEFVLLLPDTDDATAISLAEEARRAIKDLEIPHAGSDISDFVTVSAGVSSLVPEIGQPAITLFDIADKRLYQAKQRNRNCVVSG